MSFMVPDVGEVKLLKDLLAAGGVAGVVTLEAWTLKLFKSNTIPAETHTAASYTIADFTNYTNKTLIRDTQVGHWSDPVSQVPTGDWVSESKAAESTYAEQTWTSGSDQTIYGYILVGATSGTLIEVIRFDSPIVLTNGSVLSVTPRIGVV